MNKYRQAMIIKKNTSSEEPFICTKCAGWSSFGNKSTPMYIALHGDICVCTPHWLELEKLVHVHPGINAVHKVKQCTQVGSELVLPPCSR